MESASAEVAAVTGIESVPRILDVVCRTTGMGFAAVARVTESQWICCASRDEIGFGLKAGGELPLQTTICNEIRQSGEAVVIDHVAEDEAYHAHPTPALYGFQSYISVPIIRKGGKFWGTLCAIDPRPAKLNSAEVRNTFNLFAELIAVHLDNNDSVMNAESNLDLVRQQSLLREQFIAVLGHDLRSPLQTILTSLHVIALAPDRSAAMIGILKKSATRMAELVDNLMDFARARLGQGMTIQPVLEQNLGDELRQVVDELLSAHPGRAIDYRDELAAPVWCEAPRLAQLVSNLLINALKYGDPNEPVGFRARDVEGTLELSVTNYGTDIPLADQQSLFEPFVRGARPGGGEGLGLGLYIVWSIARAHGGEIQVSSRDGMTTFTFRMPLLGSSDDTIG
ncbi:GAF domain-containing sensor histidine kinase [Paucibacter sp. R3-3]|uniref:histidine kinase n=1 Tax=Roseateles agri TaxID=3098619 RepID=A0ABU5DN86_9BURK|nr:GAF domain-containing sensor histidine kinase [Paucibacter sp. R3-3]MDY0747594.1 GAF domain-containing sensor histidine kinase [Paucibacter sp. R3-3]